MIVFAAIYIRTALTGSTALDVQLQVCRDHLLPRGLAEAAVFADSGRAATAWARLMNEAKAGAFDAVVVASLDRVSRNPSEVFAISEELRSLGVEIHAADAGTLAPLEGALRALGGQPEPSRFLRTLRQARSLTSWDRRGGLPCDPSSPLFVSGASQ